MAASPPPAAAPADPPRDESSPPPQSGSASIRLLHHGAAASSHPHSLLWLPSDGGAAASAPDADDDAVVAAAAAEPPSSSSALIYPSHAVVNVCRPVAIEGGGAAMHAEETLRSSLADAVAGGDGGARVVTALAELRPWFVETAGGGEGGIAAAFSDGSLTVWRREVHGGGDEGGGGWAEEVVLPDAADGGGEGGGGGASVTDLAGALLPSVGSVLITASYDGVWLNHRPRGGAETARRRIGTFAAASVEVRPLPAAAAGVEGEPGELLVAVGTAAPRHNRVHIYTLSLSGVDDDGGGGGSGAVEHRHHGALSGHTDWVTCLDFLDPPEPGGRGTTTLLASGGHDARIRLWRFRPPRTSAAASAAPSAEGGVSFGPDDDDGENTQPVSDDDEAEEEGPREEDDDYDEDEARLHVRHRDGEASTPVSLEALLVGHDEPVTSVSWRPFRGGAGGGVAGGAKPTLMSSSMDRSILLWQAEEGDDDGGEENDERGVWVPVARLGSAGGILGGSVGSSLMGYVDAAFDPSGNVVVGHGYGGSLHFWGSVGREGKEGAGLKERWIARPPLTGHFRGVSDISWEAAKGEYLLSAGLDQTCRLWAEVPLARKGGDGGGREEDGVLWREVGRPQVHGYDMTAVCCVGSGGAGGEPPHRYVSGSDEKELRAFDAPRAALRLLRRLRGEEGEGESPLLGGETEEGRGGDDAGRDAAEAERVERAYLPSLGLSNRATAADALEEYDEFNRSKADDGPRAPSARDGDGDDDDDVRAEAAAKRALVDRLPSERDLGVASLWPEVRKLFGHDTELVCLASTASPSSAAGRTVVASSAKARGVEDAAIRLWDVERNKCVQVLKGGHRSTVAAMSFSPDGGYLASSGKDRRLCLWRRETRKPASESEAATEDDAAAAAPPSFSLAAAADAAHRRIVWSVHFCPVAPGNGNGGGGGGGRRPPHLLASGARDGTVKLWRVVEEGSDDGEVRLEEEHKFQPATALGGRKGEAVTAVSFAPVAAPSAEEAVLAVGTEGGRIGVWAIPLARRADCPSARLLLVAPPQYCHACAVKKLAWRPVARVPKGDGGRDFKMRHLTLASCGMDHGVRIYGLAVEWR